MNKSYEALRLRVEHLMQLPEGTGLGQIPPVVRIGLADTLRDIYHQTDSVEEIDRYLERLCQNILPQPRVVSDEG